MALLVWFPLNGNVNINNQGISSCAVSGTPLYSNDGKIGKCVEFGSFDNVLTSSKVTLSNKVTIAFWIKVKTWVNWGRVFIIYSDSSNYHSCLRLSDNPSIGTQISIDGTTVNDSYSGNLSDLSWHHFAIVVDGGTKKHYFDGNLVGTWDYGYSMPESEEYTIRLGRSGDDYAPAKIYMNDFRLYNHCLSSKEIKEISRGLVSHWQLNGSQVGQENLFIGTSMTANERSVNPLSSSDTNWQNYFRSYNGSPSLHSFSDDTDIITLNSTGNLGIAFQRKATDINLDSSSYYTLSCEAKCTKANANLAFGLTYYTTSNSWIYRGGQYQFSFNNTTDWQKFTLTFKPDADTQYINYVFSVYMGAASANDKFYIKHCKLEKGTVATPYTLNRNDADYTRLGLNSGIEYDTSGYGNNSAHIDTDITNNHIRYSSSINFNGSSSRLTCGRGAMVTDAITVNVWACMDDWKLYGTRGMRIISCTESGGWNFEPNGEEGNIGFALYTVSGAYVTSIWTTDGTLNKLSSGWHMFTGTYDGFTSKFYIDGILKVEKTAYTTKSLIGYNSGNQIIIGAEAGSSATAGYGWFLGDISDVRIYSTALSIEDLKELYNLSASIDNKGKLYCYEFVET